MFVAQKYKNKRAKQTFPVVANNTKKRRMAKEREIVDMLVSKIIREWCMR